MRRSARSAVRNIPIALTAALLSMWLLLNESLSPGDVLLGFVFALALAAASVVLRPERARVRRAARAFVLLALVTADVVRSNIGVARVVLGLTGGRKVRSGFVKVPLELADSHGLAVLACIVTATPGTVWIDHDAAARTLTLHVLDLKSDKEWIDWIKNRHERLLREIFE